MKFYYGLAPALIGVSIALVQPQVAVALSSVEVGKIAKQIAVLVDNKNGSGSGVIIKRSGNTYTVLTAYHVVKTQDKYEIVTPDGQRYSVNYSTVKKLPDVDLAVVQFTSSISYTIAKIGNSDESTEGATAYVAGFPEARGAFSSSIYILTDGKINANTSKALPDGYALVYSNDTLPGMSGGPVLNEKGELIGIHGKGDTTENYKSSEINPNIVVKTGFNFGIPINTFLILSAKSGVDVGVRPPNTPVATAPKADDFFIQGGDKYEKKDFQGAIAAFNEAIRLNPNYAAAYSDRGYVRNHLGDKKGAIEDYNQALRINPNYADAYNNRGIARNDLGDNKGAIEDYNQALRINPNYAAAYNNRGSVRNELGDYKGGIEDFNQALRINPNLAEPYNNRGSVRNELGDYKGGIEDVNQALRINPNYALAYNNRGYARNGLGDNKGAIEDYNQALRINPNYAAAYNNRGYVRNELGDKKGAIEDYNQALRINPNLANPYNHRGLVRYELGDRKGAMEDYNQALRINPNYADAYNNRGLARNDLGDRKGAIEDLQKAADLFQQQKNTEGYQKAMDLINKLGLRR